jgi:predicted nucleic acid-binding protein
MQFVDTNIFIRLLTADDEQKAKQCLRLFEKAQNQELKLTTSQSVLAEVVYILSSKKLYNLDREKIYQLLLPIINVAGLRLKIKSVFLEALKIYAENNLDFEDAFSAAWMKSKNITEIYSYDRDFDRFDFLQRLEP